VKFELGPNGLLNAALLGDYAIGPLN